MIRRGGELVSTGVGQIQQGMDRLLQASLDRLAPLRQAREETTLLRRRLEELEASLANIESRVGGTRGRSPGEPAPAQEAEVGSAADVGTPEESNG